MKILIISSYLPYPLLSGGQVRLYNLIKELSAKHEVTLVCEKRKQQTIADVAAIEKICKAVITVERRKQWSIANIVKAGISSHSFLATGHTTPVFTQKIHEVLGRDSFDVIHVETYYVMQNLPPTTVPIVLVEHNIEYLVYQKFMKRAPFILRPFLAVDIAKMKKEEESCWKKAKAIAAVSREDQKVIKYAGCDAFLVSNGVNTQQFSFKEKPFGETTTRKILFLGDFKWIQNRDSVIFIIKEIWPCIKRELRIKKQEVRVNLWIVGRRIPDSIRNLTNDPDVLFDEKSSDLPTEKIFQATAMLLAPIRVGGGTSYKILESMSCGTPVVTMQMSATALDATDGRELMVGQTAQELAEKSVQLLTDNHLYATLSKNGRALVEKSYTWKEIGTDLEEVYHKAVLY